MGTDRIPSEAGFCSPALLPKGPRGFPLCRKCGTETPSKRRTFCSQDCVDRWKERTDPSYQRKLVWERDAGICQICRRDVSALESRIKRLSARLYWLFYKSNLPGKFPRSARSDARVNTVLARWRFQPLERYDNYHPRALWNMDHIVPVVKGGGGCDLSNLRLLCRPCHLAVTAELRKQIAAERRAEKARAAE